MAARAFGSVICLAVVACVAVGVPTSVQAKPVTTIGELADWDPNRPSDLPKSLAKADPNAVVMAKDTVSVLPDMLAKMETVILNLTEGRTNVRLDEMLASLLPDAAKGQSAPAATVHTFVVDRIAQKLEDNDVKVVVAELEALVEAVEGGPAKDFVTKLAEQGTEVPLADLLRRVERSPEAVRDYFRPTVMTHLEHGHVGLFHGLWSDESDDPWSMPLTDLVDQAKNEPKAVQDYVKALPVWLMHYRTERQAPDVPLHQLMDMLAGSRSAHAKLIARPLATEKDLQAPTKVAYMLQEAYARGERIHTDLVGRHVVGVVIVGTLLVLLSVLRGYIKVLDIPNRRIVE